MQRDELQPGQAVTWVYIPRGGYCMPYPVDAYVLRTGAKVAIACLSKSGEWLPRYVKPASLRPRKQPL